MNEKQQYICALDIGTSTVIALVGEVVDDEINIVGVAEVESRGLTAAWSPISMRPLKILKP